MGNYAITCITCLRLEGYAVNRTATLQRTVDLAAIGIVTVPDVEYHRAADTELVQVFDRIHYCRIIRRSTAYGIGTVQRWLDGKLQGIIAGGRICYTIG